MVHPETLGPSVGPVPTPNESSPSSSVDDFPPSERPKRVTQPSIRLHDYIIGSTAFSTHEPSSYTNPLWQHAMDDEL